MNQPPQAPTLAPRRFALWLAAVYLVGVALRLVWLATTNVEYWRGTPLLTNADGYYFAAAIQSTFDHLAVLPRVLAPDDNALVGLGALVTHGFSIGIDAFAFYLPALLGPAIAFPVAWLGRSFGQAALGLVAALVSVLVPSYLTRTAAGYFDTDMFALTVPLCAVACLVACIKQRRVVVGAIGAALLAAYPYFYDQGGSFGIGLALTAVVYTIVFARELAPVAAGLGLSQLSSLPLGLRVLLAAVAPLALAWSFGRWPRASNMLRVGGFVVASVALATAPIWNEAAAKLGIYAGSSDPTSAPLATLSAPVPGDAALTVVDGSDLFTPTTPYVAEVARVGLDDLGRRVAGALPVALIAAVGAVMLGVRQRPALLLVPFAALGLFAFFGGQRFTIYLAPVVALGLAHVIMTIVQRAPRHRPIVLTLLLGAACAPAVVHALTLRPRPAVIASEADALDGLRRRIAPDDVVLSWWDYGYAIAYFARARPLVDGGRRDEDANLVAEILLADTSPPERAAHLATGLVAHMGGGSATEGLFADLAAQGIAADTWLAAPPRTETRGAVYLYLPARMLPILESIARLRPEPRQARMFGPMPAKLVRARLELGAVGQVDAATATLIGTSQRERLAALYRVAGSGKTLDVAMTPGDPNAALTGLYLPRLGLFMGLDQQLLRSTYVQLFVFERADLPFGLVVSTDTARVFRVL